MAVGAGSGPTTQLSPVRNPMKVTAVAIALTIFAAGAAFGDENPAFTDVNSSWYKARKGLLAELAKDIRQRPELVNAKDPVNRTPLFYAAKSGHTDVTEFLLKQGGVETETIDAFGYTPWHWAAMYGHLDVLRLMKRYDIEVDVRDEDGNTPLHTAFGNVYSNVHGRHKQLVQVLLEMGADPNARNHAGETPLFSIFSLVGDANAAILFLSDERVDVNAQDENGNTALHRAVGWGLIDLVRLLLERGASPSITNNDGEKPANRLASFRQFDRPDVERVARQIARLLESGLAPPQEADVGLVLRIAEDGVFVAAVLPETPAARSGAINVGDQILAVAEGDAKPVELDVAGTTDVGPVIEAIRGPVDTVVRLTVVPEGKAKNERIVVSLIRSRIAETDLYGDGQLVAKGVRAPDFEFSRFDAIWKASLRDYTGRIVVVRFWASWCEPCVEALDTFESARDARGNWGNGVEFIAASVDDKKEDAIALFREKRWSKVLPVWAGPHVLKEYGVSALPAVFVIDREGNVAAAGHHLDITAVVNELL